LYDGEHHNLCPSPDMIRMIKSRKMNWTGHVTRMRFWVLVRKPEGKRPLRRLRRSWESNIKIYLGQLDEVVWTGFIWLRIPSSGGFV
jgi:uncharacterized C2H2 Zn-finger protein